MSTFSRTCTVLSTKRVDNAVFQSLEIFSVMVHAIETQDIPGVQISCYITNFGDRIFIWRLMQQILVIVTRTVNTIHALNSSLDIKK